MIRHIRLFLIAVIILWTTAGCGGKKTVQPSADSVLATEAFAAVEMIKGAYETKNRAVLDDRVEDELYEKIQKDLFFEKAELSLSPQVVRITASTVSVRVNWRGSWWVPESSTLENRGVAELVLNRTTMRLEEVNGDSPFYVPLLR